MEKPSVFFSRVFDPFSLSFRAFESAVGTFFVDHLLILDFRTWSAPGDRSEKIFTHVLVLKRSNSLNPGESRVPEAEEIREAKRNRALT